MQDGCYCVVDVGFALGEKGDQDIDTGAGMRSHLLNMPCLKLRLTDSGV